MRSRIRMRGGPTHRRRSSDGAHARRRLRACRHAHARARRPRSSTPALPPAYPSPQLPRPQATRLPRSSPGPRPQCRLAFESPGASHPIPPRPQAPRTAPPARSRTPSPTVPRHPREKISAESGKNRRTYAASIVQRLISGQVTPQRYYICGLTDVVEAFFSIGAAYLRQVLPKIARFFSLGAISRRSAVNRHLSRRTRAVSRARRDSRTHARATQTPTHAQKNGAPTRPAFTCLHELM